MKTSDEPSDAPPQLPRNAPPELAPREQLTQLPVSPDVVKTFIKAVATVIVAGLGLLGPVSTAVTRFYELTLTKEQAAQQLAVQTEQNRGEMAIEHARLAHQVEMDFLAKLVATEQFTDEEHKTFYRRDVLRYFDATLPAGSLKTMAGEELLKSEQKIREFEALRAAKDAAERALATKVQELAMARSKGAASAEKAQQLVAEIERMRAEKRLRCESECRKEKEGLSASSRNFCTAICIFADVNDWTLPKTFTKTVPKTVPGPVP